MNIKDIKEFFNSISDKREKWVKKSSYFYSEDLLMFKEIIAENSNVLEVGCGNGQLIGRLNVQGVGIDLSEKLINKAKKSYSHLKFYVCDINESAKQLKNEKKFDYIILTDTIGYFQDVQKTLESIHTYCNEETRIIISYFSPFWQPILSLASLLKLKMPDLNPHLFGLSDLKNFLEISNFQTIKVEKKIIFPYFFLGLGRLFNRFIANLPIINHFCLRQYLISRSLKVVKKSNFKSASVIVPCRNEFGNIQNCLERIPTFCENIEVIFVEGNSHDNTWEEIQRVISDKKLNKNGFKLKGYKQEGTGKKNAVFKGFDNATNEILMILDCDLTVPPEELTKFWIKMQSGEAEFVNGTRLIYPLNDNAMRFLNYLANKTFSYLFSWILGQRYTDTLCGTKIISKKNYLRAKNFTKDLDKLDPFGDFFLIFSSLRLNLKMLEIPIRYESRSYGETQISRFRDGYKLIKMFFITLLKFKAF